MIRKIAGTLVFCFFISGFCAGITVFLPEEPSKTVVDTTGILVTTTDETAELVDIVPLEANTQNQDENTNISSPEFTAALVGYTRQEDRGLQLYRDTHTRSTVEWFYSNVAGNYDIAKAILMNADRYDIPLSLAFSLAWTESSYQPHAVNSNSNSSVDRGLFQLNNKSFPKLTEADFFDPDTSAKYGMSHLRFCLDTAGNEIAALAMYNAGTSKVRNNGTPQQTLNYVSRIISYRNSLDELFNSEVAIFSSSAGNSLLATTKHF